MLDLEKLGASITEALAKVTPEKMEQWYNDAVVRLYGSVGNIPEEDIIKDSEHLKQILNGYNNF